jgi:hypothetical protein
VAEGGWVPVIEAVALGDSDGVADGRTGVVVGSSVSTGEAEGVTVGVSTGGGESDSSAGMSATVTTPSPLTSARLQPSTAPKITAITASMSLSSTRPSQFASPNGRTCAVAVALRAKSKNIARTLRNRHLLSRYLSALGKRSR